MQPTPTYELQSTDAGRSWSTPMSLVPFLGEECGRYQDGRYGTVARSPSGGKRILMSNYNESNIHKPACVYASDDLGRSWKPLSYLRDPAPNIEVALAAVGSDGNTVYANGRRHLCSSPNTSFPAPRVAGFSTDGGEHFKLEQLFELSSSPVGDCDCIGAAFPLDLDPLESIIKCYGSRRNVGRRRSIGLKM